MKIDKNRLRENLSEALVELILTVIFFGIGAAVVSLFGVDWNSETMDSDLIILIGIVGVVLSFSIVYVLVKLFKKKSAEKQEQTQ